MELYPVVPVSSRVSYRVQWSAGHCFSFTSTTSPQASTQGWNFSLMIALSITKYTSTTTTHFSRKTSPNSSPGPSIGRWRSSLKSASYWPSPTSTTQASLDTTLMMYGWKKRLLEISRHHHRLQPQLEWALHWNNEESTQSPRPDPAYPTCCFSRVQSLRL